DRVQLLSVARQLTVESRPRIEAALRHRRQFLRQRGRLRTGGEGAVDPGLRAERRAEVAPLPRPGGALRPGGFQARLVHARRDQGPPGAGLSSRGAIGALVELPSRFGAPAPGARGAEWRRLGLFLAFGAAIFLLAVVGAAFVPLSWPDERVFPGCFWEAFSPASSVSSLSSRSASIGLPTLNGAARVPR